MLRLMWAKAFDKISPPIRRRSDKPVDLWDSQPWAASKGWVRGEERRGGEARGGEGRASMRGLASNTNILIETQQAHNL